MRVVTGTGFCGTLWIAKLLDALGYPTGHEKAFEVKRHPWPRTQVVESSLYAPCYPDAVADAQVLHLVREPVAFAQSVRSVALWADRCHCHPDNAGAHLRNPMAKLLDSTLRGAVLHGSDQLDRTRRYWEGWNRMIVADGLADLYGEYRREQVETLWVSPLKTAAVLSWLLDDEQDPDKVAGAMGDLGRVNAKRPQPLPIADAFLAENWSYL